MTHSILFLTLGIACILLAQIDVIYFRYVKGCLGFNDFAMSIRIDNMINTVGHKIWLVFLTILGLAALFISARISVATIQFPLILSFIFGFILWIILLQFSLKLMISAGPRPSICSIIIAFALPLILIALVGIMPIIFPEISMKVNTLHNIFNI